MYTTKNKGTGPRQPMAKLTEAELRFLSENQRLEGFSGVIPEQVRQHVPDLSDLVAVARRFGGQIPQSNSAPDQAGLPKRKV